MLVTWRIRDDAMTKEIINVSCTVRKGVCGTGQVNGRANNGSVELDVDVVRKSEYKRGLHEKQ